MTACAGILQWAGVVDLAFNSPSDPIIGYGFEVITCTRTRPPPTPLNSHASRLRVLSDRSDRADTWVLLLRCQDFEAKTGALTYMSILTLEACALLCHAVRHHAAHLGRIQTAGSSVLSSPASDVATSLCARANRISDAITTPSVLFNEDVGMFRPASGLESNLTDIWGSACKKTHEP